MLFTSNNCVIYSKDPDLIGKLVMHGHKVYYDSDIARLIHKAEETHPDLIVIDLFKQLPAGEIDAFIHIHGHIIIRGAIPPDMAPLMENLKVMIMPANTPNDIIIEKIAHINEQPGVKSTKPHVLIIEDNLDIQEMYVIAFRSRWYDVSAASDGLDGVTKAVSIKPDIIILDIMMPHMDGFEVLHALKNNTALQSVVIVNSNLEWVDEEKKVKELWADYFLRKSHYTPLEVISFIETQILKI
jgi:CheY-like chemotaxis protein